MEQPKPDDFDSWIVAVTGNNIYVGKPTPAVEIGAPIFDPKAAAESGKFLRLNPVYQVQVTVIPLRDQQGNMKLQREITAMPFLCTIKDEPLWVKPDIIQRMSELEAADKNRYKSLVDQASALMTMLAAEAAGIATARQMPGH